MARVGPLVTSVMAWVLGATVAVSVGLVALSFIGAGLSDPAVQPLSPRGPGEPPAASSTPDSGVSGLATSSPAAASADQTLASRGGTVIAACRPTGAYLVGWSPAPGYRATDVARGPGEVAKLKFVGDGREIEVSVRCVDGVLVPKVEDEADHGEGD
jgi:hypothetical protein